MRILVTGAAGMLGRAVMAAASPRHEVAGVDLADGDLTEAAVLERLLAGQRPEWVVHTAAYTDVDGAETQRERAMAVNATVSARIARACADRGAGLTYLSSDYVFAGDAPDGYAENAPRAPINHYGLTKARGEEAVEASSGLWQIVRTSWLFGVGPKNFVLAIRRRLASGEQLRVVDDQTGCPTYAADLASVLLFLLEKGRPGIYHATNSGACSWHAFAREIARQAGDDPERVRRCATADYPTPARRPACSILLSRRLEALGCRPRPPWQDGLARYLVQLRPGATDAPRTDGRSGT